MPLDKHHQPRFAVLGNPVGHSLSPIIHQAFARQFNLSLSYQAIEIPMGDFAARVHNLQQQGFKGVNVTVPFKQEAARICTRKNPRAESTGVVNTLTFRHHTDKGGEVIGDNTDGVGLIRDLLDNQHIPIERQRILLLGAGGAVRGVLPALLTLKPAKLTLVNRTVKKAEQLAEDFKTIGDIVPSAYQDLDSDPFDLIINGTSAGLTQQLPPVPERALGADTICYDMTYSISQATHFVQWARDKGAAHAMDGLGMLVEQAAESFFIWQSVRADTTAVIKALR